MKHLEQLVLRLVGSTGVTNPRNRQLCVLDAIVFRAAFAKSSSVGPDNGRMAKVCVDTIKARGVGNCHINLIAPCHSLADLHLLCLCRVHITLWTNNQLGSFHCTISPDFGIVAVVANDHRHLHSFWSVSHEGTKISWCPSLDGSPGQELAILLNNFSLIVDQDQGVVGILVGVIFVLFSGQRKDTPGTGFLAGLAEHVCQWPGNGARGIEHFLSVVHDTHRRIFWEDNQIHSGQSRLDTFHNITNLFGIFHDFLIGMQSWHGVLEDTASNCVRRT
mmetsp:Transcript_16441/g.41236  ORF Transcript_16441/g.41236 Transcript_16441/m.41236 type:complete len:276 (-) Transcript_16441:147-974(-)